MSLSNTFNISVIDGYLGFSSPSKFPSRLMSAGVPFGEKDGQIILLLIGGNKGSQQTDIDKAVDYLKDYHVRRKNDR
ncbi:hypothetical protein ACP179_01250 (plasmid) [Xenorhabdus stockiae]|uniref:hypothetical protein n=1 Tax=Xenorhabdus stockiae TaxID=351614 RepID=UPI003CEBFF79